MARVAANGPSAVMDARDRLRAAAPILRTAMAAVDAIVTPSCGIVAPLGLLATGPSDFTKFWTAFGLPQINLPLARGKGELLIGLQLIARSGDDSNLLKVARIVSRAVCAERWRQPEIGT